MHCALVKESRLFVFDAEFAVDGGEDALHLSEGEHTAQKRVACIMAVARLVEDAARLVGEGHAVVDAHRQAGILLLEDAGQFDEVGAASQMAGLGEVAVGEDMAGAQVHEMGARSELAGQFHHVVIGTCRETAGTEGEAVVLVGHGIEEPLDVLLGTDDARQAENLDGGIVGVYAHVHVAFLADGHDGLQEIFHVGTEPGLVDAFVEIEELAELLDGRLVVFAEITRHEALRLDDDVLHELVVLLGCHGLGQFVAFGQYVATFAPSLGELEGGPLLAGTRALQDIDVEVGELGVVEVKVRGAVGIVVEQVGAGPVEYGHEVVADAVDALGREVAQALLVDLNLVVAVRTAVLDGLYYWQALDDAPAHAVTLDILAQVADLLTGPYFPKGYVVQGGDDALDADLL